MEKDLQAAKDYISKQGYGSGTNYSTNLVAVLLANYAASSAPSPALPQEQKGDGWNDASDTPKTSGTVIVLLDSNVVDIGFYFNDEKGWRANSIGKVIKWRTLPTHPNK